MTNTIQIERQNRIYASVSTLLMLLLMLIIIFFIKFYTPIPPFEAGNGIPGFEVNFGDTDNGSGTDFSQDPTKNDHQVTPQDNSQNNDNNGNNPDDKVITSDDPSNNVVVKNDKPKKDVKKNDVKDQQPDKDLQNAFNNFNDHSDGNKDKDGNQGKPDGGDSKNYDGNNKDGTGGDGGPGKGGKGPIFNLKGRRIYYPPDKITDFTEEGTIVVDIVVDKDGKVTFAEVNRGKSINPNYVLCAKARQAALTTKFNHSPDGTMEQKGSMTFEFKLK